MLHSSTRKPIRISRVKQYFLNGLVTPILNLAPQRAPKRVKSCAIVRIARIEKVYGCSFTVKTMPELQFLPINSEFSLRRAGDSTMRKNGFGNHWSMIVKQVT